MPSPASPRRHGPKYRAKPRIDPVAQAHRMRALAIDPARIPIPTATPNARAEAAKGNDNWKTGMAIERLATRRLQAEGYSVTIAQDSRGAFDLVAVRHPGVTGPLMRMVQVKGLATWRRSGLNGAVRGMRRYQADAEAQREAWLYCRDTDAWVVAVVTAHGVTVTGLRAQEVQTALEDVLRERAP